MRWKEICEHGRYHAGLDIKNRVVILQDRPVVSLAAPRVNYIVNVQLAPTDAQSNKPICRWRYC